jgi:hypothetical protein
VPFADSLKPGICILPVESGVDVPKLEIPAIFATQIKHCFMDSIFHKLSTEEYASLKDAIPQITVLIAGADGKISHDETEWARKVTDIRSYSAAEEYQAFYTEIGESFQGRLEELISALPEDLASRNASISENLAALNPILRKLEPKHAAHLYSELKTFAKHVARASGGFLKFWSVSAEEKKWIELPMVDTFEWNEETEQ